MTPSSVMINASTAAEAQPLQIEDQEHVERGEEHADLERNAEEQVEADGRADDLGEVRGDDGELGEQPQRDRRPAAG